MSKEWIQCGGCGAAHPKDRCIGCNHSFDPEYYVYEPPKATHTYKDKEYIFLFWSKMQIGQQWIDAAVYKDLKYSECFVREARDFKEKFIKIEIP